MLVRIHQLKAPLDFQESSLKKIVAKKLRCPAVSISSPKIIQRSIDARQKNKAPSFVLSLELNLLETALNEGNRKFIEIVEEDTPSPEQVSQPIQINHYSRPVVVGAGPAGLMAAFALAEAGLKPLLFERGEAGEERKKSVKAFWAQGIMNEESNTLF